MSTATGIKCEISPNYISSDLLSPNQTDRITIPTNGIQELGSRQLSGCTWGEERTTYGGIGNLPFLGRTRATTSRDLFVNRSHRHYSSGFSKYETSPQPYQLTPLLLSSCRINDQVLPATFKCTFKRPRTPPEIERVNAYFSHTSKFEVLPCHNQNRKDKQGNFQLSECTRRTLTKYYHQVYSENRYCVIFPDYTNMLRKHQQKDAGNSQRGAGLQGTGSSQPKNPFVMLQPTLPSYQLKDIFIELLREMGPIIRHCCLIEVLCKVMEYHGVDLLAEVLLWLFSECEGGCCSLAELHQLLDNNAAHMMQELQQIRQAWMASDRRDLVHLALQPTWYCCKVKEFFNYELLPELRKMQTGQCPQQKQKSQDVQKPVTMEATLKQLNSYLEELKRSDVDPISACQTRVPAHFSTNVPLKGILKRPPSGSAQCPASHCAAECPGMAPCWPPGPGYVMDQKKFNLRCPECYPNTPSQSVAQILNRDSGLNSPTFKKVNFSDSSQTTEAAPRERREGSIRPLSGRRYPVRLSPISSAPPESSSPASLQVPPRTTDNTNTHRLERYKGFLDYILPTKLDYVDMPTTKVPDNVIQTFAEPKQTLPRQDPALPPPLSECLVPTGTRIQDSLGLSFKSEAHKRYHSMHPDPIPDLRDNHRFHKKYFFYGYHTTAFRGGGTADSLRREFR